MDGRVVETVSFVLVLAFPVVAAFFVPMMDLESTYIGLRFGISESNPFHSTYNTQGISNSDYFHTIMFGLMSSVLVLYSEVALLKGMPPRWVWAAILAGFVAVFIFEMIVVFLNLLQVAAVISVLHR